MRTDLTSVRNLFLISVPLLALTQPSASQTNSPRTIAQRTLPSVVLLVINKGSAEEVTFGSGFFVSRDVIATNHHVIDGAVNGYARIVGQETRYQIEGFVGLDASADLALVKLTGANGRPLVIADSNSLAIGDEVFAVGNPMGLEGTFSQGIVSSIRRDGSGTILQITAPISHGSSGGPVLNSRGDVVGVAVGAVTNGEALNFAIPASMLRSLVARQTPLMTLGAALRESKSASPAGNAGKDALGTDSKRKMNAAVKAPRLSTDEVSSSDPGYIAATIGAITQLSIDSDRFDLVGGGKSYLYKMSDGRFSSEAKDQDRDGIPDYVKIEFKGKDDNKWKLEFSTKGIGTNLSCGTYEDARSVWASDSGSPGMEISRTNLAGCQGVKGSFTIYDAQFDYPYGIPRVTSFAASFEQYCGNKRSGLRGTIYFNAIPVKGVR